MKRAHVNRIGYLVTAFALVSLTLACSKRTSNPISTETYDSSCRNTLALTIQPADIWGRRLTGATLTVVADGQTTDLSDEPYREGVSAPKQWIVKLTAPSYFEAQFTIDWNGEMSADSLSLTPKDVATTARTAKSFFTSEEGGKRCPAYTLFIGLDHQWFAATGRPPRGGNLLTLYRDGESYWKAVYDDLTTAKRSVTMATWWWQSNFEMFRPAGHETLGTIERKANTVVAVLNRLSGVTRRVLINQFAADISEGIAYVNTDREIRDIGRTLGDDFEVIVQPNRVSLSPLEEYPIFERTVPFEKRLLAIGDFGAPIFSNTALVKQSLDVDLGIASYHQKPVVIDTRIAYISGMNVKSTDWDTSTHAIFNSRRMKFDSTTAERLAVQAKTQLPDLGPRKDYGMRIEGPAALDAEDVLRLRWNEGRRVGDFLSEYSTPYGDLQYNDTPPGTLTAQVVATMPPPFDEQSIFETLEKAVRKAEHFIYIEDQYFRVPMLDAVIRERMQQVPGLLLIVVTKAITDSDGGKKYTYLAHKAYRDNFPERYLMLQLKSFDVTSFPTSDGPMNTVYFEPIDTHSKITIIDDLYLCVGSANKNNRGLKYEGELNVAVVDADFVKEQRRSIFRHLVGAALADQIGDDADANFALLRDTATANDERETFWRDAIATMSAAEIDAASDMRPDGFVYPLDFTSTYILDVGPDLY
ncbi:MAG: hypothetical protein KC609_01770 [Myxococcales bacterium]|nr:hypothetical protein [Myxococcales bacterium]